MDAKYLLPIKFTDNLIIKSLVPNSIYPFDERGCEIYFSNTTKDVFLCLMKGDGFGSQIWLEESTGNWLRRYKDGYDEYHFKKQLKKCLNRIEEKWLVKRFTNFSK